MSIPLSCANFLASGLAFKRSSLSVLSTVADSATGVETGWAMGSAAMTGAAAGTGAAVAGAAGAADTGAAESKEEKSSPGAPTTAMILSTGAASPSCNAK